MRLLDQLYNDVRDGIADASHYRQIRVPLMDLLSDAVNHRSLEAADTESEDTRITDLRRSIRAASLFPALADPIRRLCGDSLEEIALEQLSRRHPGSIIMLHPEAEATRMELEE